ncbi:hypothetical protein T484DRAFT_1882550 [Baffinella frigidus]|nr:hypothetical protein T484DRAFT_1882550 [Cryptophyta sp. CCMP2293]
MRMTLGMMFADQLRMTLGAPRNYDPERPRVEREATDKAKAETTAAAADAKRQAEEEASRSEREAKAKRDADNLAKLREEERQALMNRLRARPGFVASPLART